MNHTPLFTDKEFIDLNTSSLWSKIAEKDILQKIEIVKKWQDGAMTLKLTNSKEIQLQGYFINDFFGDILGYKNLIQEKTNWHIEIEQVTLEDNTRPDGMLGFFSIENGLKKVDDIRTIIELKAFDYDLDREQSRLVKITPIEQAFQYVQKSGENCKWVILSNFKEIRLYRYPDKSRYELFNIFKLHEINELKKFLYLLYNGRLFFSDSNFVTSTEKLYTGRLDSLKDITNRFYAEYKDFREKLFDHLWKNNHEINKLQLLTYTQKIVDRLLFIRFAGDTFMEFNVLFKVRNAIDDLFSKRPNLYWQAINDLFDSFDGGYNSGNKIIPEFNGELFKRDDVYNNLKIGDFIIKDLIGFFLKHDFKNNLKVEILGHIFEQSITDLQELKIKHLQEIGSDFDYSETVGKRKSDGVFYTPEYITEYMIKESVGKWLSERDIEIFEELRIDDITTIDKDLERWQKNNPEISKKEVVAIHLQYFEKYKKVLTEIKIIDISCGSGAFLTCCFDYLSNERARILKSIYNIKGLNTKVKNKVSFIDFEQSAFEDELWQEKKEILINNLYGVDLNAESVDITKLSLWLKTANKNVKLADLQDNIKVGNSLIDDKRFKNHFSWEKEFPEIIKNGGFDLIVGNPPWSSKIPNEYLNFIEKRFDLKTANFNIFAPFILKAIDLTNKKSLVSLLIPKVFIKNTTYTEIRKKIIENHQLFQLIDFGKFPNVASDCVAIIVKKSKEDFNTQIKRFFVDKLLNLGSISKNIFQKSPIYAFAFDLNEEKQNLIEKIKSKSVELHNLVKIKRGIELGQKSNLVKCQKCDSWNETGEKYYNKSTKKTCKNCDEKIASEITMCISNDEKTKIYKSKCVAGKDINKYKILHNYFIPNELKGIEFKNEIFIGDRIFVKRISTKLESVFINSENNLLAFNTVYSLFNFENSETGKLISAILNSKLIEFYYENVYNLGMNLTTQITIEYLKEIPIFKINYEKSEHLQIQKEIIELVDKIQNENTLELEFNRLNSEINQKVYELYELTEEEIKIIENF